MDTRPFISGEWAVECRPEDGARLSRLRYRGHDLLTREPEHFRRPAGDFGEYETRPVYGYDDCFPTVDPCRLPGRAEVSVRDHGELCWQPWVVSFEGRRLTCRTRSTLFPPVEFARTLTFGTGTLTWRFEVANAGAAPVRFLHVMHALMPVDHVAGLRLPEFDDAVDEPSGQLAGLASADACARFLLGLPRGGARMLLLRGVREGRFEIEFDAALTLRVEWPAQLLPTLGVWWNRSGYPDEDGCRRAECALEPIPGPSSSLARAWEQNSGLSVEAAGRREWEITWNVTIQS
jgi:hypothetical protein